MKKFLFFIFIVLPILSCGYEVYYESSSSSSWQSSSSELGGNFSSSSSHSDVIFGTSVDYYDETYETVVIGTQTWFKRNLSYNPNTGTSACYNNEESNCSTYGRLYDWSTAMGLASSCNSTSCSGQVSAKHRGICPSGWHIPSNEDWDKLMRYVDGSTGTSSPYNSPTAGRYLKAASGWNSYSGIVNLDSYGFSALPGGYGAYSRYMRYDNEGAYWSDNDKSDLSSIRCIQD
ncbi:MAG: hypothetical protein LBH25_12165 [Fibromonadaceae bacterium]|jgi:uncharacterized protein (TIGR02145 family)|nr:hypothetical protein [Fibromonadaceae bacterium]